MTWMQQPRHYRRVTAAAHRTGSCDERGDCDDWSFTFERTGEPFAPEKHPPEASDGINMSHGDLHEAAARWLCERGRLAAGNYRTNLELSFSGPPPNVSATFQYWPQEEP